MANDMRPFRDSQVPSWLSGPRDVPAEPLSDMACVYALPFDKINNLL